MTRLGWGRRYLMCPPDHFAVTYEINPWMHREVAVDRDLAMSQWEMLVATLRSVGADVDILPAVEGLPDLVFTANAGVVNQDRFVPSRFRHAQRRPETAHCVAWFEAHGFAIDRLPDTLQHEGAGDALPFGSILVAGQPLRSDAAANSHLADRLGVTVLPVELVSDRFYHLDMTFCPLDDRRAIAWPGAWDAESGRRVRELVPELLALDASEADQFVANSVVVGDAVVMPACPIRVGRRLRAWGFQPVECEITEFQKAGGGCRCLTLALDVSMPQPHAADGPG